MDRHTIYYRDIPIGTYANADTLRLYDVTDVYLDNIDKFDDDGVIQAEMESVISILSEFLAGNLPSGARYQVLTEKFQSVRVLDLVQGLDEFSGDISIDRVDNRRFEAVPDDCGVTLSNSIEDSEFIFTECERSKGERPSAMAGFFDKFTAVIEADSVIRPADWQSEIGNVIVKPQGENYPKIGVNEAFCVKLAGACGIDVPRCWTVNTKGMLGTGKRHFVTERFGVHSAPDGSVYRDMVFDTGMLLAERAKDQYSISSEDYFKFMRGILPEAEMRKLAMAYLFGYMVGNSDMHVKNFSVFFHKDGFKLTPIYDIVSYKPYGLKSDMALTVGGNTTVSPAKFCKFIRQQGLSDMDIAYMAEAMKNNFGRIADEVFDKQDDAETVLMGRISDTVQARADEIISCLNIDRNNGIEM